MFSDLLILDRTNTNSPLKLKLLKWDTKNRHPIHSIAEAAYFYGKDRGRQVRSRSPHNCNTLRNLMIAADATSVNNACQRFFRDSGKGDHNCGCQLAGITSAPNVLLTPCEMGENVAIEIRLFANLMRR